MRNGSEGWSQYIPYMYRIKNKSRKNTPIKLGKFIYLFCKHQAVGI